MLLAYLELFLVYIAGLGPLFLRGETVHDLMGVLRRWGQDDAGILQFHRDILL